MNEQQLAAVKQALEALKMWITPNWAGTGVDKANAAHAALQSIISQDALDKKADNARELGLSYDDAVKGGVGIMLGGKRIDPASIYAEPKIGCVNHDCDKCRAQQEPVGEVSHHHWRQGLLYRDLQPGTLLYTTPPAPQPVPVKTYHDGKPWPVAPKPWVGLTNEEIDAAWPSPKGTNSVRTLAHIIEAKLKEKNT
jgi:hypothetical protein